MRPVGPVLQRLVRQIKRYATAARTVRFMPCRNGPLVVCSGCLYKFDAAGTTACPNCGGTTD